MRRLAVMTCGLLVSVVAPRAFAQDADLTFTQPPVVMLAIDSSGSMQWRGGGIIRDDLGGVTCALGPTERSREIAIKEVLTGTFNNYSLRVISPNSNSSSNNVDCNVGDHQPQYSSQAADGLLDLYRERIRFAFSNFDAVVTNRNDGAGGDWSYPGSTHPSPVDGRVVRVCGSTSSSCSTCSCSFGACVRYTGTYDRYYCIGNTGIKSERGAPCSGEGCLVSAGAIGSDIGTSNDSIQLRVLGYRSTGNTPIASALQDVRWWFDNHPDVRIPANATNFQKCRKYYTLLLTDGIPNQDCGYSNLSKTRPEICFRFGSCSTSLDCPGLGVGEWTCVSGACQHVSFNEPTQASVQRAVDLFNPSDPSKKSIPVHVIGFESPQAITCTQDSQCPFGQTCKSISGGSSKRCSCDSDLNCDIGESCRPRADGINGCFLGGNIEAIAAAGGGQALFANDPVSLRSAINQIFSTLVPETTSRTRPTSTAAVAPLENLPTLFPNPNAAALFVFQAAFVVPPGSNHWKGFLQRVSIGNIGTASSPVIGPITQQSGVHGTVSFDALLNAQPSPKDDQGVAYTRQIYTWKNGSIVKFDTTNITPADLNVATTTERNNVVNFIRGEPGTARATMRLGATYHSSPVVLEPPILDLALASYQTYRSDATIRKRPPMVFIGSNLGMLHAFNGTTGKEEWAFIPPTLLPTLKSQLTGFTWGVDTTPVARDIQLTTLNQDQDPLRNWRGVVAFGVGYGASAYYALDVTNPVYSAANDPPFRLLWQLDQTRVSPLNKLGIPFGTPEIGTVFLDDPGAGFPFQERAVAIIPGGKRPPDDTTGQGEDIWVLDMATGATLRRLPTTPSGAEPTGSVTGTCAAMDDFPGNFITRVFCGDSLGRIIRLNLADPVISRWTIEPTWADLYQGVDPSLPRQPIYAAPTLAFTNQGRLMVIGGNGDPNDLQSLEVTRFGFVEETPNIDSSGVLTGYSPTTKKLHVFDNPVGEKLTGSPVIFNGVAYYATFVPDVSETCSFGRTRLWGVQFDKFNADGSFIPKLESKCGPDGEFDTADDATGTTASCLLPVGSVSFGFDLVRTPSVATFPSTTTTGQTGGAASTTQGGELKLVFQTGTAAIEQGSALRDPQLTPPGSQQIQVGAINLPDLQSRVRVMSWGKVLSY